jgi:hypothetical protein
VAGACRWGKEPKETVADHRARARMVRAGRVFVAATRGASLKARRELELAFPYGTTWLAIVLDLMRPTTRSTGLRGKRFVAMLCAFAEESGGKLTLNERENRGTLVEILEALKPYLPAGFVPTSPNALRRLKEDAAADWFCRRQ